MRLSYTISHENGQLFIYISLVYLVIVVLITWAVPLGRRVLGALFPTSVDGPLPWVKHVQVWLVLLAFIFAWWLATIQAKNYYLEQQQRGFDAFPHVRVWTKEPLPKDSRLQKLYQLLPQGEYQLLLQNKGRLFLFILPRDGKATRLAVTQLALNEIEAVRVLP